VAYMKDSTGRRLDGFEAIGKSEVERQYARTVKGLSLYRGAIPCASRSGNIGSAANLSNGTDTGATTLIKHRVFTLVGDVRLVYANIANGAVNPDPITVKAGVMLPDNTILPVRFGGAYSTVIGPGGYVISDPVPLPPSVIVGTILRSRTYVSVTAGQKWPLTVVTSNSGEGVAVGSDAAHSGTIANSFTNAYGPLNMIGAPILSAASVAIIGDSIAAGQGDSSSGEGTDYGYIQRALFAANIGYVTIAKPGDKASDFLAPAVFSLRFAAVAGCSDAIVEYGINDINNATALATIKTNAVAIWRALAARGVRAHQTTITPSSRPSNTAPEVNEASRVGFNTWLRDGAPVNASTGAPVDPGTTGALRAGDSGHPLVSVFEVADVAETARNSGLWKPGYSNDHLHPNSVGHAALAAGIDTTRFALAA
jgi:lysophospholipase L1-like esterase